MAHSLSSSLLLLIIAATGVLPLAAVEQPRRADAFVDAMGLNAHLDDIGDVYSEVLTGQLGIRHYRSNVKPGSVTQIGRFNGLYANYGVRVNLVCDSTAYTPVQYRDFAAGAMFESVEGLNEPDYFGPRAYAGLADNWTAHRYDATLAFQQDLFAAMTGSAATSGKLVLSPAMSNPLNARYLRPAPADAIAMHNYPDQQLPTANFLSSFILPAARLVAAPGDGVLPLIVTETGYRSGYDATDLSPLAARKYLPRTFAEYFRLGVARTYLFELADKSSTYHFGLVDTAFSPKPAYTALKNLTGLLREAAWNPATKTFANPGFTPAVLDYTMTSPSANVHHVLLQKSNGSFYLLLWQEVPSYDLAGHVDLVNPTVPVKLAFNLPLASGALYQLSSAVPVATYGPLHSLVVNVPDEVMVLRLDPGASAASSAPDPVVSLVAPDAAAATSPLNAGAFAVTRTGGTAAPLTVFYAVGGSATNGLDYEALTGSVLIPAGASSATIPVTPRAVASAGRKEVVLTLAANAAYTAADVSSATVFINGSRGTLADFATGIPGWAAAARSAVSWDRTNGENGSGALKWVFTANGVDRWSNNIGFNFTSPQDWTAVSRLEVRIKEDPANPASDIARPISFTWVNNGVKVSGTAEVAKFPLSADAAYRTVSLDLGSWPRDRVTNLQFYVDGAIFATGPHTFYFDNVTAVTDTNGMLEDFEQNAAPNWSSSARSTALVAAAGADTGRFALKWTYADDGGTRWSNTVKVTFPQPPDLSRYSTLCLRFREDAANPSSDTNARVYLDWTNDGVRASSGGGVDSFPLVAEVGYRTVELNLMEYSRDRVNTLFFFLDGNALANGSHTWYLDNISVY